MSQSPLEHGVWLSTWLKHLLYLLRDAYMARHAIYVTEVPFDIDLTCHCHQWRTREDKAVGAHSRLSLRPCQGALGAPPHLGTSVSAKKSQILQEALTKQTNKKPLASGDPCLQTYRLAKVANAYKPIKKTVFNLF
jgi:hypothetical protein